MSTELLETCRAFK